MNRTIAIVFAVFGVANWYAPGFAGIYANRFEVTDGEGMIVSAIFLVGAGVLWFMKAR